MTLQLNAWRGGFVDSELGPRWRGYALPPRITAPDQLLAPPAAPRWHDCTDRRVGWGIVAPENPSCDEAGLAAGDDLPAPLQRLLAARRGVAVRYGTDPSDRSTRLIRHYPHDPPQHVNTASQLRGTGVGVLPHYLLLVGGPDVLPWTLQFDLALGFAVGRLHLTGAALGRYVDHLLTPARSGRGAVVWSADHGPQDVTSVLRDAVARPLVEALRDPDVGGVEEISRRSRRDATGTTLVDTLARRRPGLVLTTSHGWVPAGTPLADGIGLPVGDDLRPLDLDALFGAWQPDGAIWYSHACCSAGTDSGTPFEGLVSPGSTADLVLADIAGAPPSVAPLATRLLGAERPARAFVGHVEPTFDVTVRDPRTGQNLALSLPAALYDNLYQPHPIGLALAPWFRQAAHHLGRQVSARREFDEHVDGSDVAALVHGLAAADHRSLVVLGDPAATVADP